jgi:hypothetical protein
MKNRLLLLLFCTLLPVNGLAREIPAVHLSRFASGAGPAHVDGVYRLLDGRATPGQSNAVAFDLEHEGPYERMSLHCKLRVLAGGDGGAMIFLNTAEYGKRGPAPFVKSWVEPILAGTFAVGVDVHDPPNDEPMWPLGNYMSLPEREVSLHWDGREIVKRVAPAEFRGDFAEFDISVQYVTGGAEVTVRLAGSTIYDGYFVAGMRPYESRLAIGAGTRKDVTTEFDVRDLLFSTSDPTWPGRRPQHFEIFNHVLTGGAATANVREVTLPPLDWGYGRVILTLEIHDAGQYWDSWDRNGYLYVIHADGVKYDIAPFITSFQTPCHWKVDVTHFRPWLAGKVTFEIATDGIPGKEQGYMMSASLDFYHDAPDMEPYRVVPLWVGTARYKSADNHFSDFFTPRTVFIDESARAARLFMTTTGHSQVGEFTPSWRSVIFVAEKGEQSSEQHFENLLWKTDCYLNPNRPQQGTWKYARAGWAPGDVVRPWWIDLTPYFVPGRTAVLRYAAKPYDFSLVPEDRRPTGNEINQAIQIVRAYLILYRSATGLMPASNLKVLKVVDDGNAAKAGIRVDDWLISNDGRQQQSIDELRNAIKDAESAGKKRIAVVVYRGDDRVETTLGPGLLGVYLEEH